MPANSFSLWGTASDPYQAFAPGPHWVVSNVPKVTLLYPQKENSCNRH